MNRLLSWCGVYAYLPHSFCLSSADHSYSFSDFGTPECFRDCLEGGDFCTDGASCYADCTACQVSYVDEVLCGSLSYSYACGGGDDGLTSYEGAGWCVSSTDDYIGDFASASACWEGCLFVYGDDLVAIDYWAADNTCFCQDDCFCRDEVGSGSTLVVRDSFVLPDACPDDGTNIRLTKKSKCFNRFIPYIERALVSSFFPLPSRLDARVLSGLPGRFLHRRKLLRRLHGVPSVVRR